VREQRGKREEMVGNSGVYMGRPFGVWEEREEGRDRRRRFPVRSNGRRLKVKLTDGAHLSA
jgi:hypothetical protein